MPGGNYIVFKNLRPPVCIDSSDGSPLRGRQPKRTMRLSTSNHATREGFKVTKEMVVRQLTDDGHIEDSIWNKRHAIHPTAFNDKNSTFYKVNSNLETTPSLRPVGVF